MRCFKRIAFLPANGLGDALLFTILAHNAVKSGAKVTIFHRFANELAPFFPKEMEFEKPFSEKDAAAILSQYTLTLFQNDHSSFAYRLHSIRRGDIGDVRFVLPKPSPLFMEQDIRLDPTLSMVENLQRASYMLFESAEPTNGSLLHQTWHGTDSRKVILHPFSGSKKKNWLLSKYIDVAKRLVKLNYDVEFVCHDDDALDVSFPTTRCSSLQSLVETLQTARFFIGNDSGPGHLASLIGVPTVTIAGNKNQIKLWKPSFTCNAQLSPPFPLPNFKGIGLPIRDKYWQYFVRPKDVVKALNLLY